MLASSSRSAIRRVAASSSSLLKPAQNVATRTVVTEAVPPPAKLAQSRAARDAREGFKFSKGNAAQSNSKKKGHERMRGHLYRYSAQSSPHNHAALSTQLARYNMQLTDSLNKGFFPAMLRICHEMKKSGVRPDATTYHLVLAGCAANNMHREALAVLEDMERMEIEPDIQAYHYAMQSALHEDWSHVWELLDTMLQRGIEPNEMTYEIILKRHCASANLEHALRTIMHLDAQGKGLTLTAVQHVIALACEFHQPRIALDLAEAFHDSSFRRLEVSDWLGIVGACANDLWGEGTARSWHQLTQVMGSIPDEGTSMLVLHTAARNGMYELANDVIMNLQSLGIPWREYHVAPLIEALARAGRIKEALGAFDLIRQAGVESIGTTAQPIFDAICNNPDKIDEAWGVLEEMHEQGKTVDNSAFNVIVHACAASGDLQRAIGVYKSASQLGVAPNVETFNFLLKGCVIARHRELGDQLLGEMRTAQVAPDRDTYTQMILLCLHAPSYEDAFFYLEEMKAQGHVPLQEVYEQIVQRCINEKDSRWELAAAEMAECGYTADGELAKEMKKLRGVAARDARATPEVTGKSHSIEDSKQKFLDDIDAVLQS